MDVVHPKRGCEAGVVKPTNPEPEPRMNVHKNAHMTVHGRYLLMTRVRERGWRCCQANANRSPIVPERGFLGRQLAPLGQCGGAVVFEGGPSVQVTVVVEDPMG
jgi:hypothetical protein